MLGHHVTIQPTLHAQLTLFVQRLDCVDHLLNLVTKLAFKDLEESNGAINKVRELVGHFSSSSQEEAILLSKQMPG